MTTLIFFILGLMIGSFLNALVYRLRVAEKNIAVSDLNKKGI